MSVNIQGTANGAGRNSAIPGLGIPFGADVARPEAGEGRDFATVMRDLPRDLARPESAPADRAEPKDERPSEASDSATSEHPAKKADKADENPRAPASEKKEVAKARSERKHKATEKEEKKDSANGNEASAEIAALIAGAAQAATAPADDKNRTEGKAEIKTERKVDEATSVPASDMGAKSASETSVDLPNGQKEAAANEGKATTPAQAAAPVNDAEAKSAGAGSAPPKAAVKKSGQAAERADRPPVIAPAQTTGRSGAADEASAPVVTGEATKLLSLVKGVKASATAETATPAKRVQTPPVEASGQQPIDKQAAAEVPQDAPSARSVTPRRGEGTVIQQGKTIPGLAVAAQHAAKGSAVVQRVTAAAIPDAPAPAPAAPRTVGGAQVSTIAIAAAQTSDTAGKSASGEGSNKKEDAASATSGPPGDIAASAGDTASFSSRLNLVASAVHAAPAISALAAGTPDIGAALGQRVVDLGVSSQWIDDIAREIASLGASQGQGSFRIASEMLGAVRVDITPGSKGTDILMTVDNEAAQRALLGDRQRLVQDAQLAAIRIGEVHVDRVSPSAHAQSGDMGSGGQQGQNNGSHSGAQTALGQNAGQNSGHSPRHDLASQSGQGQNGNNPKASFTRAVLGEAASGTAPRPTSGRRDGNARYA